MIKISNEERMKIALNILKGGYYVNDDGAKVVPVVLAIRVYPDSDNDELIKEWIRGFGNAAHFVPCNRSENQYELLDPGARWIPSKDNEYDMEYEKDATVPF